MAEHSSSDEYDPDFGSGDAFSSVDENDHDDVPALATFVRLTHGVGDTDETDDEEEQHDIAEYVIGEVVSEEDTSPLFDPTIPLRDIHLKSTDGKVFTVPENVARMSTRIKGLLDGVALPIPPTAIASDDTDLASLDETESEVVVNLDEPIALRNITASHLGLCLHWCEYHKLDPRRTRLQQIDYETRPWADAENIPTWDMACFGKLKEAELFDLICAAAYMDIEGLIDVLCKMVANTFRGKSPEELRTMLNLPNDYSEVEQALLDQDNYDWAKEYFRPDEDIQ